MDEMNQEKLVSFEGDILRPTLLKLANLTQQIENKFEKPISKNMSGHWVWRYENPRLEHIVIQRLYRIISGLKACYGLLRQGQIQEIGVILRTITEFQYDIMFLLENYGTNALTQHQKKFIEEITKEGYIDINIPFLGAVDREMVSRKKVLASVARSLNEAGNESDAQRLVEIDTDIFSGYVHGAYPNVMDIYGQNPSDIRYHPFGIKNGRIISTWITQIMIYLERAVLKTFFVAHYFGLEEIKDEAFQLKKEFSINAKNYGYSLEFKTKDPMGDLKKGKPLE